MDLDFFNSEDVHKVAMLTLWNQQGRLFSGRTGQEHKQGRLEHKFLEEPNFYITK